MVEKNWRQIYFLIPVRQHSHSEKPDQKSPLTPEPGEARIRQRFGGIK